MRRGVTRALKEAAARRCSTQKVFFKIAPISQENIAIGCFF